MPSTLRQLFLRHLGQTSEDPMLLEIQRGEGVFLYGPDGKRYFDFISGIGVSNVGHGAPEVIKAIKDQADLFLHSMVYGEFVQTPQVLYASKLASLLGEGLDSIFFVNSGSEATEGALKLAKKYTGRSHIVSFSNAYHGSTHGALSVAGSDDLKEGFGPLLPETTCIPFNDTSKLDVITNKTACVIIEPIQGEAGIVLPVEGFLQALKDKCKEMGALLIFDECQTGFGRSGSMFAHQKFNVKPDILTLGKALGGGMPLGAFVSSPEIMSVLTHDPVLGHITTFGGHPVCCAAGLAALTKIEEKDLISAIPEKEKLIREILNIPQIKDLRGSGLMFAAEIGSFETVLKIIHYCLDKGLITDWFLFNDNSIRIAPPLTISLKELRDALEILKKGIEEFKT